MTTELKEALQTIVKELNLVMCEAIRDYEGLGPNGPRVQSFSYACSVIKKILECTNA